MKILPVILSGGSGTRLWPMSRKTFPKQLQALCGDATMIQQTALRLKGMEDVLPPIVVCNEAQRFQIAQQLKDADVQPSQIILEPEGRNTAPAIALPALCAEDPANTVMIVMSSDHYIDDVEAFQATVMQAAHCAMGGYLMTIGIQPTKPHTGFGYIQKGKPIDGRDDCFVVTSFKEKPDAVMAQSYLDAGNYYWNAGIFAFRIDCFLNALKSFEPTVVEACRKALEGGAKDADFTRLDAAAFAKATKISVDYAVMERADKVGVVPASFAWNDVGGWNALHELNKKDSQNNVTQGDVMLRDVSDSYIRSESRLVSVIGLDDVVVVETLDAVMVASRDKVDEVKEIVERLKVEKRTEHQ